MEVTANLRPNPVFLGDAQFLPIFSPGNFTGDYFDNVVQFDVGVSYLFERGEKRDKRTPSRPRDTDQTAVTVAQVTDNERTLTFNVASQFIAAQLAQAKTLELANADLGCSFRRQTVLDVNRGSEHAKDGAMAEGDYIKIHLQQLQFEMDVSAAGAGAGVQAQGERCGSQAWLRVRARDVRRRRRPRLSANSR